MALPRFLTSGSALSARTYLESATRAWQEGKFTSYSKVINYLLATYAIEDFISDADMEMDMVNSK